MQTGGYSQDYIQESIWVHIATGSAKPDAFGHILHNIVQPAQLADDRGVDPIPQASHRELSHRETVIKQRPPTKAKPLTLPVLALTLTTVYLNADVFVVEAEAEPDSQKPRHPCEAQQATNSFLTIGHVQ